ncbi:NAD(P)H-dependent FMN reductase [Carnobacterium iners]|uniref:NAD(P)H-dependent FMN reductase n=1 Tax=Carnobacterium iners TaxID=1073423 RepID=A0A1X7MQ15_9LACT|nr:NADPH-dependent FMN reductase [Carnobacterium iners]SEL38296.1 NAD(P)H-dependent FMN reductase [Carnobacterium iners]SMH26929.1 NAD(P)H-dependent FMN reductase [Carnobacterium iners]
MLKIGIITGSTRPNRKSLKIAEELKKWADKREDALYEVVDIADYNLPMYNEPIAALYSQDYQTPEAIPWAEKINSLDGFIFVVPEYNHGLPSALKNAIDYLCHEYGNKVAGSVTYGSQGGIRAGEVLRLVLGGLHVAVISTSLALSILTDFDSEDNFIPEEIHQTIFNKLLDRLLAWGEPLKVLRDNEPTHK